MKLPPRTTLLLTFLVGAAAGACLKAWTAPGETSAATLPAAPVAMAASGPIAPASPVVAAVAASEAPARCPPTPAPVVCPSAGAAASAQVAAPTAPAVVAPVKLSAEHAAMVSPPPAELRPLTLPDLHAQLLGEGRDAYWSAAMEQSIRQALAAGNASGEFDVPTVECRQSLCEVMGFGNQPGSMERWGQLWKELAKQPWYGDFKTSVSTTMTVNDRHVFATIIQRKPR